MIRVDLVEVFSSVQGEGPHLGRSTLFVRLGGCDLRCRWCDSPHTWQPAKRCRLPRGGGGFDERENPVPTSDVVEAAEHLGVERHRFVSLTGGEPLLQPGAVVALAAALRGRGPRVLLETHGLEIAGLERAVAHVDVVSMDWKLASDVRRAGRARGDPPEAFHTQHAEFLRVARRAPEVYVKVVVSDATRDDELEEMAGQLAAVDADTPLILQPVTPQRRGPGAPSPARLLAWHARLERRLGDVRLVPQAHPVLGIA